MNIQRVLIPTDLSEVSGAALQSIDAFIEKFNCKVDLMHVIPLAQYLGESFDKIGIPLNMEKDVFPKMIEHKREELNEFAKQHLKKEENRGNLIITIDRKPSDSIMEQIKKVKYDLVMMSSKGGHSADFFHGSTTDKIIRHSKVPVFTLTEKLDAANINTIVVPCDFSNHSLAALPIAFDMAAKFGAHIEILNVIELYAADIYAIEPTTLATVDEKTVYTGLMKRLRKFLEGYQGTTFAIEEEAENFSAVLTRDTEGRKEQVKVKTVVSKSVSAHHEIIDYANEHGDLLVMSTHGRTGLSRMLLGSTAEQVVQHIAIPQITIKPELKEEK